MHDSLNLWSSAACALKKCYCLNRVFSLCSHADSIYTLAECILHQKAIYVIDIVNMSTINNFFWLVRKVNNVISFV